MPRIITVEDARAELERRHTVTVAALPELQDEAKAMTRAARAELQRTAVKPPADGCCGTAQARRHGSRWRRRCGAP